MDVKRTEERSQDMHGVSSVSIWQKKRMSRARTAYILLWFPKPSETFVFREVVNLRNMGLPLKVFTLYGELRGNLSPEMGSCSVPVERLGIPSFGLLLSGIGYWLKRNRRLTLSLFLEVPWRRWNGIEKGGESLWAFLCAFHLSRRFEEEGIEHIHAPFACGPATAAWVASRMTGIPFSFTGRGPDIYPPDGAIREKIRNAVLVRSDTKANQDQLMRYDSGDSHKFRVTYIGVPLDCARLSPVPMTQPIRLLAAGRFVSMKGFDLLIRACAVLAGSGLDFHLTLVGDGPRMPWLKYLVWRLNLRGRVSLPGFVSHDRMRRHFEEADIFVMPSVVDSTGNRDGLPTVILEAFLHRVPVISTEVSGIPEIIVNGLTGLLIPPRDLHALADAIRRMTEDRARALWMAEQGRKKVLAGFDPLKNHRKLLEIYEEVIGAGGPARCG
jgi:colanic acid/amylovoran biosynthesis glycosyltransferase